MKEKVTISQILENASSVMLILKESGPWADAIFDREYARLQNRVYNSVIFAADGYLAKHHPRTKGKRVIIKVEISNLPKDEIDYALTEIKKLCSPGGENHQYICDSEYISDIDFECTEASSK